MELHKLSIMAVVALALCLAPAAAHAYLINNTPLDLSTANIGAQVGGPLVQAFQTYDESAVLSLEGVVTSSVYELAGTFTFVYEIALTGGYGGFGLLDAFQINPVPAAFIDDSGYDSSGDAFSTAVDYSGGAQIVEWQFHNYDFDVGDTASVWLQTTAPGTAIGTGDLFAIGGNGIIDVLVPVPEPATLLLLSVCGGIAVLASRRK